MGRSRTVGALLLACALLLASTGSATAAQTLGYSPPTINLAAAAGETITANITVTAPDDALTVELVHMDVGFDGATYNTKLISDDAPETTSFSTRGWFSLPRPRYRVRSGGSRVLPLQVAVPENTPGGTYIGAAILRPVPDADAATSGQVRTIGQGGPIIFIAVEGGDPPKPTFDSIQVPRVARSGPVRPKIAVGNDGDDFFTFSGTITLTGPSTDEELRVDQQYVVPDEPRSVRLTSSDKRDADRLRIGDASLGIGRYELQVRLRTEPSGKTLVATRTIWIIPTWAWIVGGVLCAIVLISIAMLVRWFRARRLTYDEDFDPADDDQFDASDASTDDLITEDLDLHEDADEYDQ